MTIDFPKIKAFIKTHKLYIFISLFYFSIRIINLTKIPIFNDEGIYLYWGNREISSPDNLFYSLYDAKQPLLMWFFGIFENIFSDPLFAGRFVSVITGFLAFLGIYRLTSIVSGKKTAILACFLYSIIPIFSFFDRQALMESSVGAVGVWSCIYLMKTLTEKTAKNALILGTILGLGFFIKSTAAVFVLDSLAILFIFFFVGKDSKKIIFLRIFQTVAIFIVVDFFLFIQPQFWQTLSSNDRYSLTLTEILHFPFSQWVSNALFDLRVGFFYITPLVFLAGVVGIVQFAKNTDLRKKIIFAWVAISLLLQILAGKSVSQRYLVSYLPLFCLFAAYFFAQLFDKAKDRTVLLVFCSCIIPFLVTMEQIFFPDAYFFSLANFTQASQLEYMQGYTSGQDIGQVMDYINTVAKYHKTVVTIAVNTGNPENALQVYYAKNKDIPVTYLDGRFMGKILDNVDCLKSDRTVLFVSRGEFLTNLNRFLDKATEIHLSDSHDFIGIYTLKNPCSGRILNLNFGQTN